MREKLFTLWTRFLRCESGVTLVEYAIALTLTLTLGAAAFTPVVDNIKDAMSAAGNEMVDP